MPLPPPDATLQLLRAHWRTHHHPLWRFPTAPRRDASSPPASTVGPIGRCSLQSAFVRAVKQSGVHKRVHVHTLRHSDATATPRISWNPASPCRSFKNISATPA